MSLDLNELEHQARSQIESGMGMMPARHVMDLIAHIRKLERDAHGRLVLGAFDELAEEGRRVMNLKRQEIRAKAKKSI